MENPDTLASDIKDGIWDNVLMTISGLKVPMKKLINLYEHIILEMVELREMDVARALLKQTQPMNILKQTQIERYQRLEGFLARMYLDPKELYPQGNKMKRRQDVAGEIMREISSVEPSRLLSLLSQSLKYQYSEGSLPSTVIASTSTSLASEGSGVATGITTTATHYDLFRGLVPTEEVEEEIYPRICSNTIKFTGKNRPEVARFSPDGQMMIVGAQDGFMEVYSPHTARLRTDLPYQSEHRFMSHETAILCMNFSSKGEYMVTGTQDGSIKIWRLATGECVKQFPSVHSKGVTSVSLSKDDSQVLSSSFDGTAAIHGIKSGSTLRQLKGHLAYVNAAHWTRDNKFIVSASSDGFIRIWDSYSGQCVRSFTPGKISSEVDIHTLIALPYYGEHQFVVGNHSNIIYLMNLEGEIVRSFSSGRKDAPDFVAAAISPKANWLYAVTSDGNMQCFNILTEELAHSIKIHEKEVIGLHHHPFRNLLLSYSTDGTLKIWKP